MAHRSLRSARLTAPPRLFSRLAHETDDLRVGFVTLAEDPELVRYLAGQRAVAFGEGEEEGAAAQYGLDDYDRWAVQIVAQERATGELAGALRVAVGRDVLAACGPQGFYLQQFWELSAAEELLGSALELGRVWLRPNRPNPLAVLHALYVAVDELASRSPGCRGLFGTLSVLRYPLESCRLLTAYLRKYYPCERGESPLLRPREPFCHHDDERYGERSRGWGRSEAFRRLCLELRRLDASRPVPFLLHVYLKQGATLLGDVAVASASGKLVIPLYIEGSSFHAAAQRVRG